MFGYALLGAGWLVLKTEGAAAGDGAPARALRLRRRPRGRRRREPLDALRPPRHRRALVLLAEHRLARPGSDPDRAGRARRVAGAQQPLGSRAVPLGGRALRAVLSRPRDQPFPDDRAVQIHDLAGRLVGGDAGLPAGRRAGAAAGHSPLLRLVVLGVPRQGARRYRLSLRAAPTSSSAPRPIPRASSGRRAAA